MSSLYYCDNEDVSAEESSQFQMETMSLLDICREPKTFGENAVNPILAMGKFSILEGVKMENLVAISSKVIKLNAEAIIDDWKLRQTPRMRFALLPTLKWVPKASADGFFHIFPERRRRIEHFLRLAKNWSLFLEHGQVQNWEPQLWNWVLARS